MAILNSMMGKTGCLTSFSLARVSGRGRVIGTKLRRTRLFDIKFWSVGLIGPGAAAVLFLFTALASAAGLDAVDPLFGLRYDASSIRFEAADAGLTTTCTELVNARWNRKLLIYASAERGGVKFLVVGGFYVPRTGTGRAQPDRVGAILQIKGNTCKLMGPARETFDSPTDLSKSALMDLANNAACRYSSAFGSHAAFMTALRRQRIRVTSQNSPILYKAMTVPVGC